MNKIYWATIRGSKSEWEFLQDERIHRKNIHFIIIIIEFNSGTIKIELDNTMWTVQPEQGQKG